MTRLVRVLFLVALSVALSSYAYEIPVTPGSNTVTGVVSFSTPRTRYFFVRSDTDDWWRCSLMDGETLPAVGDVVVVSGEVLGHTVNRRLDRCTVDIRHHAESLIPRYEVVTIADLFRHPVCGDPVPDRFGRLVTVAGRVTDINRRLRVVQCIISDGAHQVGVNFDLNDADPLPEGLERGATVRVSGVYVYVTEPQSKGRVFEGITQPLVMLDGVRSLEVLSLPPFWTTGRVIMAIGIALFISGALMLWVWSLRRTVARQVMVIEKALRDRAVAEGERRERLRLSHDLHDDFQQLLSGSLFRITAALNWMSGEDADVARARTQLEKARADLVHTQSQLRAVLWGLKEESEGPGPLVELFRYAAGRMAHWAGKVEIVSTGHEPHLARTMAGALLMILQEAVGNALRHGKATRVKVHVDFDGERLTLRIVDDGCGFDLVNHPTGLGLTGMEDRTRALGGRFKLLSEPNHGTCVIVEVKV